MANLIIPTLFETPGATNFSHEADFEVQPGVFSPVYINFKAALAVAKSRKAIAESLTEAVSSPVTHVVGIESGGSYYASAVADNCDASLVLCRKDKKQYNIKNRFAGVLPEAGDSVLIVDDVMSSGNTLAPAVSEFTSRGCDVEVLVGFSYCWEDEIAKNLGVRVVALSTAEELISYGKEQAVVDDTHERLIREYIENEQDRLVTLGEAHG